MNYSNKAIEEIYRWFDIFNKDFFENKLEKPYITIQRTRKGNLGHCSVHKVWVSKNDSEIATYEINIAAQSLGNDIVDISSTLLHEMIHLGHLMNEIKDCSNKVHNKKFKKVAESLGFIVEHSKKYGWGHTTVNDELREYIINTVAPKDDCLEFVYIDVTPEKEKEDKPKKTIKFICPNCDSEAKAKPDVKLLCGGCNVAMESEFSDNDEDKEEDETELDNKEN